MEQALQRLSEVNILQINIKEYFENEAEYLEFKDKIIMATAESTSISVLDVEDIEKAAHYIKNFNNLKKKIDALRLDFTRPLDEKKKEIKAFFDALPELYADELSRLKQETLRLKQKLDEKAKKKAAEEAKRLEEEALKDAIKEGVDNPAIVPEVVVKEKKLSSMNVSSVSSRRYKQWRVLDESIVPREFLTVDPDRINLERKKHDFEAKSTIPGIEFYFEEKI